MAIMTLRNLRKVLTTKYSDTKVYIQVGDKKYAARPDKVMTCLSGDYITLVADESQVWYEEPVE